MDPTEPKSAKTLSMTRDAIRKRAKRRLDAIKKGNDDFAKLAPAAQRIAIAKDVLAWLDLGKLKARAGRYVVPIDDGRPEERWYDDTLDARSLVLEDGVTCEVCALGGMFACAVGRLNKINAYSFRGARQNGMREYLSPYFSPWQLALIETAFECEWYIDGFDHVRGSAEAADAAVAFGERYTRDDVQDPDEDDGVYMQPRQTMQEERMRAIMQNIIANGGEFKP